MESIQSYWKYTKLLESIQSYWKVIGKIYKVIGKIYKVIGKLDKGLPPKGVLSMKTLMHPTAATPQGVLTSLAHSA